MKVLKTAVYSIIVILMIAGCNKEREGYFQIDGKLTHGEGQMIYLEELHVANSQIIDSSIIDKKGEFHFIGTTTLPAFYLLKLNENKFITLLIDSAEQVTVTADAANFERFYQVDGSIGSTHVKLLNDHLTRNRKQIDSIRSLSTIYGGSPDLSHMKQIWSRKIDSLRSSQVEFSKHFVLENPFSMASILALYQKFDNSEYIIKDLHSMRVAASALNTVYPESEHVKALYQNTLQLLNEEKNARLKQLINEKGENSPEITLPDADGNTISLRSLRGNVVLLQFWSANDLNSRIVNQTLTEAYSRYKNSGFMIYQVSVDQNRDEWLNAINDDQLTWINVGDMEGSIRALQAYNIRTIPYNYLLNEKGEIIAQDLRGPALGRALERLFK